MLKVNLVAVCSLCFYSSLFGQEKKQELSEMQVTYWRKSRDQVYNQSLQTKEIEEKQATDLGDLLLQFSGISLKNYGGVGGLKTFSFKGIGSAHTVLVQDGFLLSNAQIGQVNLGTVSSQNLRDVTIGRPSLKSVLPANAYTAASVLELNTLPNESMDTNFRMKALLNAGSFGYLESNLSLAKGSAKWEVGAFGHIRNFQGKYPFKLAFNNYVLEDVRKNNNLTEGQGGFNILRKFKSNAKLRLVGEYNKITQGLPGAVVLYNPAYGQYLDQDQQRLGIDFTFKKGPTFTRIYAHGQRNFLRYKDSTFLNTQHFLESKYELFQTNLGATTAIKWKNRTIMLASDGSISTLARESDKTGNHTRFNSTSALGLEGKIARMNYQLTGAFQHVQEGNGLFDERNLPSYFAVASMPIDKQNTWSIYVNQSYSNRIPSFSEIYMGAVPNTHLDVEKAWQNEIGASYQLNKNKWRLNLKGAGFFNKVQDKLVAIPTKNLFVWSIQNVGEVDIYGADAIVASIWNLQGKLKTKINSTIKYAYQLALDKTDRSSTTYGHQIAYIPFHTVQADLGVELKGLRLFSSLFYSDYRYALNENTTANLLPTFYFLDLGLSYRMKLKNNHAVFCQFQVKNLSNEWYYFVRSYPMPGRNYLITLIYEI